MPTEGGQVSAEQRAKIMTKLNVSEEMARKIQIAKDTPDAKVPIQTNQDVLRYYPGER